MRHGESRANATGIREGMDSPLTAQGILQCERVAKRLQTHKIERLISSDHCRALHLAKIISRENNIHLSDVSGLFGERRNPSIFLGSHVDDESFQKVWQHIRSHRKDPCWRHSDEENFEDFLDRAKRALEFLRTLPEERIVVATHGMFMKMIFAYVTLGEYLTSEVFWDKFIPIKNVRNTGIMELQYTSVFGGTDMFWKLISWNDHAHLDGL